MNNILRTIKRNISRYAATALAALCFLAVPFTAACSTLGSDEGKAGNNIVADNSPNANTGDGNQSGGNGGNTGSGDNGQVDIGNGGNTTTPVEPENPVTPVDPVDPIDPVDPVDPVDPIDPVDPEPIEPGQPDEPVIPEPEIPTVETFADLELPNNEEYAEGKTDWSIIRIGGTNAQLEEGWRKAVIQSTTTTNPVKVILTSNWTAQTDFVLGTSFGSGAGFGDYENYAYGPIKVPVGAQIILDLNGYKIDRALSESVSTPSMGMVIMVNGALDIVDSRPTATNTITNPNNYVNANVSGDTSHVSMSYQGGVITGGMNNYGGGIYVGQLSTARCTLLGGSIAGNIASDGGANGTNAGGRSGGVYMANNATFVLKGGKVSYNTARYGGGIYLNSDGNLDIQGGEISYNVASAKTTAPGQGGGLYLAKDFVLNAGAITHNDAVSGNVSTAATRTQTSYGGGVQANQTFVMNGGEISYNTSLHSAAINASTLYINGGVIDHNTGARWNNTLDVRGKIINFSYFYFSGGEISNNSNPGRGMIHGGRMIMTGGKIFGNNAGNELIWHEITPYDSRVLGGEIYNNVCSYILFAVSTGPSWANIELKNVSIHNNTVRSNLVHTYNYSGSNQLVTVGEGTKIYDNTVSGNVIYGSTCADVHLEGGEIYNNTVGSYAVFVENNRIFEMKGAPQVYGNHASGSTTEKNVYVNNNSSQQIDITGPLSANGKRAHIGLTLGSYNESAYPITSGYGANVGDGNTFNYFFIDNPSYQSTRYYSNEVYYYANNRQTNVNAWQIKDGDGAWTALPSGASSYSKTYDGKAVQVRIGSGSVQNMTSSSNGSSGSSAINAGTYLYTGSTGSTYKNPTLTITVLPQRVKVSGTPTVANKTYDGNTNATVNVSGMKVVEAPSGVTGLTFVGKANFPEATIGNSKRVVAYISFSNENYIPDVNAYYCYANITAAPVTGQKVLTGLTAGFALTNRSIAGTLKGQPISDTFIKNKLTVTATYSDGTSARLGASAYSISGTKAPGTQTLTASYTYEGVTKTADFTVDFLPKEVVGMRLTNNQSGRTVYWANRTYYFQQQSYIGAALVYADGTTGGISSNYISVSYNGGTKDVFGQPCGTFTVSASYEGWISSDNTIEVIVTALTVSSVTATFTQPNAPIFKTTNINDLKQYLTVSYTRNDGVQGALAANKYTINGTLRGGTVSLTVTSTDYGVTSNSFNVVVQDKEIVAIGTRVTQTDDQIIFAGYPLTILPNYVQVKVIYNTDMTEAVLRQYLTVDYLGGIGRNELISELNSADTSEKLFAVYNKLTATDRQTLYNNMFANDTLWGSLTRINDYSLSGSLATAGLPYITVTYGGVSARFQVKVTAVGYTNFAAQFNSSNLTMYDTSDIETLRSRLTIYTISTTGKAGTAKSEEYNLEYAGYYDASNTFHNTTPTTGRALQRGAYNLIRAYYVNNRSVSTTFRVWVDALYIVGIEAKYTQPAELIFVGAPLSSLTKDLTVRVIMSEAAKSYTLQPSQYTLSGDMNEGNMSISVTHNGFRTSFSVRVTAVRVQSITATFTQGSNLIYATTPNSTLRNLTKVTATYNNGTSAEVSNYSLTASLVAGATVPVTVTYLGRDIVEGSGADQPVTAGNVKVEDLILVRLRAEFNAAAQSSNIAANTLYETHSAAETAAMLAKIPQMKLADGTTSALVVTPYFSKNGKLLGAKPGAPLKPNEYELAVDPKMGSENLAAGANEITISYGGFVASVSVNVTKIAVRDLDIAVHGINDATTTDGVNIYSTTSLESIKNYLTVNAYYNNDPGNASPKLLSADDYRLEAPASFTGNALNDYTVIYTEDGITKSKKVQIYVQRRTITSLSAVFNATASDSFFTDDGLADIGHAQHKGELVVTATYSDGQSETIQYGAYTVSGTLVPGTSILTVNYGGKSDTFEVKNVQQARIDSISITSFNPNNIKIYTSTPFASLKDLLTVTYTMNSGKPGTLSKDDYTVTGSLERVTDGEGVVTEPYITVVYNKDNTITDTRSPIIVEATRLDKITVEFNQSTANNGGELIVYAGTDVNELKGFITRVLAHYTDGATSSSEEVLDYALQGSLATAGTSTVTAIYNGKSATFNVRVTALAVVSVRADFRQVSRVFTATPLETIKNMLTVTPVYNNGQPGTPLKANEYKLERAGAYLETYDGYQSPEANPSASDLLERYVWYGENPTDEQIADSTLEVTFSEGGVQYRRYYRNATEADVAAGTPIYHITRSHTVDPSGFIAGELGLFRVIPNAYPTLEPATFTANIDSARLIRIEATLSTPTRTVYDSNPLDILREWLVVNAVYEEAVVDGDTSGSIGPADPDATYIVKERIIGDYTLNTASGKLNAGNCSVAVGYNGLIDSVVVQGVQAVAVESVTAVYNQEGKVYESTPLEDLKDMLTITAYNNDGSSKVVGADGYTLEIQNGSFVHNQTSTITVTLKENTAVRTTFTVDVENNVLVSISVGETQNDEGKVTLPAGVVIYTSTELDMLKQYIPVYANLSNNGGASVTSRERVTDFAVSGELTAPTSVLLISYNGKITSCVIEPVTPVLATGISASIDQTSKVYTTTDLQDLKSMITVNATYNNGTSGTVDAKDYTLEGELTPGATCAVTVRYTAAADGNINTVTVYVDVEGTVLSRITYEFTQGDNDIVYASDNPEDIYKLSQWLRVYAHYSVGGVETEVQEVGGYTLSGDLTAGYIPILITYNGLTAFFNAQITSVSLIGISVSYTPVTEVYAATPVDSLKDMLYVEAYYNNGKTEALAKEDYYLSVESNETVDGVNHKVGYFVSGEIATVTVTYGKNVNLQDKFTVAVENSQLKHIKAAFTSTPAPTLYGNKTLEDIRPLITVTAYYDDGGEQYKPVVVSGYTLSGVLEIGKTNRVSVFYSGAVDYINVEVKPITLTGISVSYKQTIRIYETTPLDDIKDMFGVTALYNDGSTATVASEGFEIYTVDNGGNITDHFVTTPIGSGENIAGYTANVMIKYTENGATFSKIATIQLEKFGIIGFNVTYTPLENTVFYALNNLDDVRQYLSAEVRIGYDTTTVRTETVTDYLIMTVLGENQYGTAFAEGENTVVANYNGVLSNTFTVYVEPKTFTGLVADFTQVTKVFETTPLFDLKDMLVVYKEYNDGTRETVTGYSMSVVPHAVMIPDGQGGTIETISNVLTAGTCFVHVTYNDGGTLMETQFSVTVEPVELSYISVDYVQTGNLYTSDDLSDLVQWLKVWAHYDNDSVIEIITGYNLAGNLYAGTSTISVTYGGKQTTFSATVTEVKLVSMSATLNQNAKVYDSTVIETLKSMLTVNLIYNDGNTKKLAQDEYLLSGMLVADQNSRITVVYLRDRSQEAFFYVHVVATKLDRIEAEFDRTSAGDIFTSTNPEDLRDHLVVTAYYAANGEGEGDISSEEVFDYIISGELTEGTSRLTINYNGYTAVITVNDVIAVKSTKIDVSFDQTGVAIYRSTPIDSLRALMKVTVTFNDGRVVDDFEDYTLERVAVNTAEHRLTVRISYGEATPVDQVVILEEAVISRIEVSHDPDLTFFTTNKLDYVKTRINVIVHLSDGTERTLTASDYTLEGTIAEGTPMLTVRYSGSIAKFTVKVVAPKITGIRVSEFVQGYTRIYDTTPLEYIARLVTVTATYDDGTEAVITDFNITGTLIRGVECPITISVGELPDMRHTFNVKVESGAISGIDAVQTLPLMTVHINKSSAVIPSYDDQGNRIPGTGINADNSQTNRDHVKSLLVVRVYPQGVGIYGGLDNVPEEVKKAATLNVYEFEMTGDLSRPDENGKVTLVITYTGSAFTLTASIVIDVYPV